MTHRDSKVEALVSSGPERLTHWPRQIEARDALLAKLGFASFDEYRASEAYQRIRDHVLERDGRACRVCNRLAADIHHLRHTDNTLIARPRNRRSGAVNRRFEWVVALCRTCHHLASQPKQHPADRPDEPRDRAGSPTLAAPRVRRKPGLGTCAATETGDSHEMVAPDGSLNP